MTDILCTVDPPPPLCQTVGTCAFLVSQTLCALDHFINASALAQDVQFVFVCVCVFCVFVCCVFRVFSVFLCFLCFLCFVCWKGLG